VDEALRGTVSKFYQAYVDGKFRAATQYVAEDSQDIFFEADKRRCHRFEILKVDYNDEFTKATVLVNCATDLLMPPKGLVRVMMPLSSKWKSEEGKWMWYVVPRATRESAFGQMKPGEGTAEDVTIPKGPSIEDLMKMVSLDRHAMTVKVGVKKSEEFVLTNGMTGALKLTTETGLPADFKIRFEPAELKGKDAAKVIIEYDPREDKPRMAGMREEVRVIAEPMNRSLPVVVTFEK
jgi:hypothetical protein